MKIRLWLLIGIFSLSLLSVFLQSCQNHSWYFGNVFYLERSVFGQPPNADSKKEAQKPYWHHCNPIIKMLETFIPPLIGAVIGASLALWGGIWKADRDKRIAAQDSFCIFIEIKKLDIPPNGCGIFKKSITKDLWVEFAKLTLFLSEAKRNSVKKSIATFAEIKDEDLSDQHIRDDTKWQEIESSWGFGAVDFIDPNPSRTEKPDPRFVLSFFLNEIIKAVHKI